MSHTAASSLPSVPFRISSLAAIDFVFRNNYTKLPARVCPTPLTPVPEKTDRGKRLDDSADPFGGREFGPPVTSSAVGGAKAAP